MFARKSVTMVLVSTWPHDGTNTNNHYTNKAATNGGLFEWQIFPHLLNENKEKDMEMCQIKKSNNKLIFFHQTYVVYVVTMVITVTSRTNSGLRDDSGYHHVAGLDLKMANDGLSDMVRFHDEVKFRLEIWFERNMFP